MSKENWGSLLKFITNNWIWKLVSFMAAVILWVVVININNPVETQSFTVAVNFTGQEVLATKNLVWANKTSIEDSKITIKVRGNRLTLEKLKLRANEITAIVNLQSELYSAILNEPSKAIVNITLPSIPGENMEIIEKSAQYVEIILEKIETVQKDVTVELTGEVKTGYVTLSPELVPNVVQVTGSTSALQRISMIKVDANISGASEDVLVTSKPTAYDSEGNEVAGVTLSASDIMIKVPVRQYKKITIDGSVNQGMPENDYVIVSIDWIPKEIEVLGTDKDLAKLDTIVLPPLNLSGINESKDFAYDIKEYLPDGITINEGYTDEALVKVIVAKEETKEFEIPIDKLTVSDAIGSGKQYEIEEEGTITLKIKGLMSILDTITIRSLNGNLDINDYEPGRYDIPVDFVLPTGTVKVGTGPTVRMTITDASQTATTEETEETEETQQTQQTVIEEG